MHRFSIASLLVAFAAVVVLLVVLELTNVTNLFHRTAKSGTIPTLNVTTKHTNENSNSKAATTSEPSGKNNAVGVTATPPAGQAPAVPFGSFVSNHRPNLSGAPAPAIEQSTCNTSPGATCYIEFTKDNVVKKLYEQSADSNGVVSWSWDVNKAGFIEGNWKITAVATLNGQTSKTSDSMELMVGP